MFCPECRIEYRPGFAECADCRVALVPELPPEGDSAEPDLDLVTILEDNNPVLIAMAKGELEDAGIPFYVLGEEFGVRFGPTTPLIHPWCRIQVGRDRETEARALLEVLREVPEAADQESGA